MKRAAVTPVYVIAGFLGKLEKVPTFYINNHCSRV